MTTNITKTMVTIIMMMLKTEFVNVLVHKEAVKMQEEKDIVNYERTLFKKNS